MKVRPSFARVLAGEIDRHCVALEQLVAELLGEIATFLDGDVLGGIDLDRIDRADARMGAALLLHVDELVSLAGGGEQRLLHRFKPPERLYGKAIEVGIRLIADKFHPGASAKRINDLLDDLAPRAVAEVGIRKDVLSHDQPSLCWNPIAAGLAVGRISLSAADALRQRRRQFTQASIILDGSARNALASSGRIGS